MHHIKPHVARPRHTHDCVGIGAVIIDQTAGRVNDLRHFTDIFLKQSQSAGVGQHQSGGIRSHCSFQRRQVDCAVRMGLDFHHVHPADGHGRRIGPMRRIRHNDLGPVIAALAMISPDQFQSGQFAMSTGHRLQGHGIHTGDFRQHRLQLEHQTQSALGILFFRQRVQARQRRYRCNILINLRIVLHRAGSQRIKPGVDAKSPL